MSERALLCEGIIRWPYCAAYLGPNRRTTSASSTSVFVEGTLTSTISGSPSLEEAVGGLTEQLPKILAQRFGEVGIDLRGAYARMPQKYLNQANVHALFEQVRGKAVPERVRPELVIEAALVSRLVEGGPRGGVGQVRDDAATGEEPLSAAVKLPDRAKHIEDRFGQRKRPLLVSLADHAEDHLLRVDRRDGQGDRLADPQTVGVDESEASAIDGFLELGDQAAAIGIAASVRETLLKRLADFFLVNKGHS